MKNTDDCSDMFNISNLKNPRNAINDPCNKDEKIKCGLKMFY